MQIPQCSICSTFSIHAPEIARTKAQTTSGNKSLRPTRIDVGSRSVRLVGCLAVVTWTAIPLPSGKGSETISNRSPYILMWWEELYPRVLILTQSSVVDLAIPWFMTAPLSCDGEILKVGLFRDARSIQKHARPARSQLRSRSKATGLSDCVVA